MKQDIVFSSSLLPQGIIPMDCAGICQRCLVSTGAFVKKGDDIVLFSVYKWKEGRKYLDKEQVGSYLLKSDYEGYAYNPGGDSTWGTKEGGTLFSLYSSIEEIVTAYYPTSFTIEEDEFSSEKRICWYRIAGNGFIGSFPKLQNGFWINYLMLSFSIDNKRPVLCVFFDKKKISLKKNDTITFKFEDNSYLSFPVTSSPGKIEHSYYSNMSIIPIFNNNIATFADKGWTLVKIEHSNGDAPHLLKNEYRSDYCFPFSSFLFKQYTKQYLLALDELGIVAEENAPSTVEKTREVTEEACFVYLMVDTSNGYHKIGISNHPEYREKTLQSEKPTIEKICAKQFPSRQIATAIESALHSTFASKRIRGEWFNLSDADVSQIIQTLK